MTESREEMEFDFLFVGGGPANLAGAIRLMQLAAEKGKEIEVCLIEKGDTIGAHSLSGAIVDPVALQELIPDYKEKGCPVEESECREEIHFLTSRKNFCLPFIPKYMHNDGCFIVSLSKLTAWLGEKAEEMGVNIFPGFPGTKVLYNSDHTSVRGVRTADKGIDKEGNKKANFEPGIDLIAKVTVFGEGSAGSLMRDVGETMGIFSGKMPQVFETSIKEVIELPETNSFFSSGTTVVHTFGYPLGLNTKGGGFLYRMKDNMVSLGLVVGLDYEEPLLEPYDAFLQFKATPLISEIIRGGKVIQQGAKILSAGGYYTIPKLAVDGALFVGDSASMLNIQRLKGIHTAMKSGMLAAETMITALELKDFSENALNYYPLKVDNSWIKKELYEARNFTQALAQKGPLKFLNLGAQYVSAGRGIKDPLSIKADNLTLKKVSKKHLEREKAPGTYEIDGKLYIDKLTGVFLSGVQHEEDQACHLIIHDYDLCAARCYEEYRNPCTRFCPGQVYEIVEDKDNKRHLKLNPSNCLHCKTCEIKDPYNNITWTCPEGGGPNYSIV